MRKGGWCTRDERALPLPSDESRAKLLASGLVLVSGVIREAGLTDVGSEAFEVQECILIQDERK